MDIRDTALNYCRRIENRLVILPSDLPVPLSEIEKGVLFVWATWSTQATQALEALAATLSSHTDFERILLFIADNDAESTEQFMDSIGQTPGGLGETFWINNGDIVARLSNYTANEGDILLQYHRNLLSAQ